MAWTTYVRDRVERFEDDLRRLAPATRTTTDYIVVWRNLRDTRVLAGFPDIPADLEPHWPGGHDSSAPPARDNSLNWLTGDCTERTYAALHRADAALILLLPDTEVRTHASIMLSRLPVCGFPPTDARISQYRDFLQGIAWPDVTPPPAVSADVRAKLKGIQEDINRSSDALHYRSRTYRNMLLFTAAGVLVVFLVFSLAAAINPQVFSLCGSPSVAAGQATAPSTEICPGGGSDPHGSDVFLLGLAGMVGGTVGALILLLRVSVGSGPFSPAVAQALLKLPAGALVALVGLYVLQHNTLGTLQPQAGVTLVAWAILFGVGQEVITHAIDRRAANLLGSTSGPPRGRGAAGSSPTGQT